MSIVKRGAYGYGGYGYGQSKPVLNYHTTNSDSVTTVVTEMSRLSVNEKSTYTGAAVQKHATLEEVCEEKEGAYSAHHGGGTMQKHGYSEQKASYQHGSGVGGYGGAVHQDSPGAAQKHGYGEQKAYQHGADAVSMQKHGYGGEHQAYQYGGDVKGYTALHQENTVQKHGYGGHKAYQHGSDVVGGYGHDGAVQKHGYGGQKAYQHGSDAGGYGAVPHDTTVQKHGYGEHKAQKQYGYGGAHKTAYDDKHGYNGGIYQPGCDDGVAGYDALVVNKTTQKQGYGRVHCAPGHGAVTGTVHQIAGAGGYHVGTLAQPCESEESDCSDDESDCEEELAYGQHGTGGLQHHDAYKQHGAGGNKLGSTHQYSAYERRQNLGGGSHYESYQSTTTQGYSGGGYGW